MPILPFGEYRPDVSDYQGQHTKNISNVVPKGDGYGPFPAFNALSTALTTPCRGFFYGRKTDGSVQVFAGTTNSINTLNSTDGSWSDISSTSTGALGSAAMWKFAQFNKYVFATHANIPLQVYSLSSSTAFAAAAGSPPQAAYITVVNRFLVLSGIASPNITRVQWSGLNDVTSSSAWTSGVNSSDSQDLPDGGFCRGVSGGEYGLIVQDASIRRMTFAPGAPYVFAIDRISEDDGIFAPGSLVGAGDRVFFCSVGGFKMFYGGSLVPIGKERVDRTFFADVDTSNLYLMIGAHDPQKTRVYWAYKSINGQTALFDKILCYDWVLDKWSVLSVTGEYLASLSRPGLTLEGIDTAYGTNIDTIALSSLDDVATGAIAALSAVDSNHKLGFFTGSNLEATLETPEQGADGRRIWVNGFRPVCDSATVYGSVSKRETPSSSTTYSTETAADSNTGVCPARVSTRYARGKIRIPAAETWTYASGVEPEVRLEGQR